MAGESDLAQLIQHMNPTLNEGEFVFVSVPNTEAIPTSDVVSIFQEKEGKTLILNRQKADKLNFSYDFVSAWITLEVHSDLNAVGLTAAFSQALTQNNISCNVVAGYYHDHIFVNYQDRDRALATLLHLKNST